jgi:hypothetical protein
MILGKMMLGCFACGAIVVGPLGAAALAKTPERCEKPQTGTKEAPMISPPLADVVTGVGRLQFYSAPNFHCAMNGVFVIPKDELIEYARTDDGWSSVMYFSSKAGNTIEGWVRSARLKETGTVGPTQ